MILWISGLIPQLFYLFFFTVPLILLPVTSEVFEFNKMLTVYIFTSLITGVWLIKMCVGKKVVFKRTVLDIPILLFLAVQIVSLLVSFDQRISTLGFYSRFNGGFISNLCYSLLFWAFVSNMNFAKAWTAIKSFLLGAVLVSMLGVLEHFGIDKGLWIQDVEVRVFSTLGQPNWLAAYLTALIPLTWALAINNLKSKKFWLMLGISVLFFLTILFTKSRSGLLGFGVSYILFWSIALLTAFKNTLRPFILVMLLLLLITILIGTPWSPSFTRIASPQPFDVQSSSLSSGPALETGGTESGEIRKIVWRGAIEVWKHYPILGTGPETFAISYYLFRPQEHNLVSEWDFLYNKAHNEYLNLAANTGTLGIASYLLLIFFCIYMFIQKLDFSNFKLQTKDPSDYKFIILGLWAGFVSLLITNFFGFSVVVTQLELFLFPAFCIVLTPNSSEKEPSKSPSISGNQKLLIGFVCALCTLALFIISRYWFADTLYAKGKAANRTGDYISARDNLTRAVNASPREAIFWDELSYATGGIALSLNSSDSSEDTKKLAEISNSESEHSISLSPNNPSLLRSRAGLLIKLSAIDASYLTEGAETLKRAKDLAPTDPKIFYTLGLIETKIGGDTLSDLQKAIDLKPNYKEARIAKAKFLIKQKNSFEAEKELRYILENIDPNDQNTKDLLNEISPRSP